MNAKVTVNAKALDKFIAYANSVREQCDQEFLVSVEEHDRSEAEFDALVAKLNRRPA